MKRQILLFSMAGLVCGTTAALLFPPGNQGSNPLTNSWPTSTTNPVNKESGEGQHLTDSWKALQARGSAGWQQRLGLFTLAESASSSQIRRLLDLTPLHDKFARESLLRRWLAIDPTAAGAWAAQFLKPENVINVDRRLEMNLVFTTLAAKDPAGTQALILSSTSPAMAVPYTYSILEMVLEKDLAAGIAFGATCREPYSVMHWYLSSFGSTSALYKDPARAAALLEVLPRGGFRDHGLCGVIAALAKKDFNQALALHLKNPGIQAARHEKDPRASFYQEWAKRDPDSLIAHVNGGATGPARQAMKEAIASALGEKDPLTALPWIAENLSGRQRNEAAGKSLTQLTKSDPDAARNYLAGLPESTLLDSLVKNYLTDLPLKDHTSIFEQAAALPEGPARVIVTGKAYANWFQSEPGPALQQLASIHPRELPDDLWSHLGRSTVSAEDGINRLNDLPARTQTEYVKGLWERHLMNAPVSELNSNLDQLTDPAHRSAALNVIASNTDPSKAIEWGKSLTNPTERQQMADILQKTLSHFPAKELESMLAPLR